MKFVKATSPASDHCENLLTAMNMAELCQKMFSKNSHCGHGLPGVIACRNINQYALGIEVIDSEA